MCGRIGFKIDRQTRLELQKLGIDPDSIIDHDQQINFNTAPTEPVPVVHQWEDQRAFSWMRWWLHPHWSRKEPNQKFAMFNARVETLATSRAYKGPYQYRRCIVPASYFIEWKKVEGRKQPYLFEAEEGLLLMAGIWDLWREELMSCSVVTQPADKTFEAIHHRMPLLLTMEQAEHWLNHTQTPEDALSPLVGQRVSLKATPVSPAINNARNKDEPEPSGDSTLLH